MSYDTLIAEDVERFGHSLVSISDVEPGFTYSVGLMFSARHPELVVFGRDSRERSALLGDLVARIRAGERLGDRMVWEVKGTRVAARRVHGGAAAAGPGGDAG